MAEQGGARGDSRGSHLSDSLCGGLGAGLQAETMDEAGPGRARRRALCLLSEVQGVGVFLAVTQEATDMSILKSESLGC